MRRVFIILVAVCSLVSGVVPVSGQTPLPVATPVTGSGCDGEPSDSRLLYTAWPAGAAGGDLVVADMSGRELRRIAMPPVAGGFGLPAADRALIWTEDGEIHLVDADAGTATRLAITQDTVEALAPVPTAMSWGETGTGWWVLGGIRQPAAYLVNLETGATHDVAAAVAGLGDEYPETRAAFVAPDDKHILIWTGTGLYLIDTAAPDQVRALGDGGSLAAPGFFRAGGAELVYSRGGDGNRIEVVIEELATGAETIIPLAGGGGGEQRVMPFPLPGSSRALLIWQYGPLDSGTGGALEVLDLDRGETRFLIAPGRMIGLPLVDPAGEHVLIGTQPGRETVWRRIDLGTGEITELPELNGMLTLSGGIARWALFFPLSAFAPSAAGEAGASYISVDLATGGVTTLLRQRPDTTYTLPVTSQGERRYALMTVEDASRSGLLLLDLATATARTIMDDAAGGIFSPDGCWVAAIDEAEQLWLVPVGEGPAVSLPGGGVPIWVSSEPAP